MQKKKDCKAILHEINESHYNCIQIVEVVLIFPGLSLLEGRFKIASLLENRTSHLTLSSESSHEHVWDTLGSCHLRNNRF